VRNPDQTVDITISFKPVPPGVNVPQSR
jgi:hypothetical protein